MIHSVEGGSAQYEDCKCGFHEYEWSPDICRYVCFFCLHQEEKPAGEADWDSEDEFLVGLLNIPLLCKASDEPDEGSQTDSPNGSIEVSDDDISDDDVGVEAEKNGSSTWEEDEQESESGSEASEDE